MRFSPHPLPFLFHAKSRTTRIIAWEIAQLYTLKKMGTYDWLSVNPRGNTGYRRKSKNNLRGNTMGRGQYEELLLSPLHNLLSSTICSISTGPFCDFRILATRFFSISNDSSSERSILHNNYFSLLIDTPNSLTVPSPLSGAKRCSGWESNSKRQILISFSTRLYSRLCKWAF